MSLDKIGCLCYNTGKRRKEGIVDRLLYHCGKGIAEFPEIRAYGYHKDFYFGFYCTHIRSQAVR